MLVDETLRSALIAAVRLSGALAGWFIAAGCVRILRDLLPANFPRTHMIQLDAGVFGFTLGIGHARAEEDGAGDSRPMDNPWQRGSDARLGMDVGYNLGYSS